MTSEEQPPHPADDIDRIEMLQQPLTTEEGYINEACINELSALIHKMPETHERLAGEPEWATPWITTDGDILSNLARCAVQIWHGVPPDLVEVLGYVQACLKRGPFKGKHDYEAGGRLFRMTDLSLCEINKFLWDVLGDLPQFMAWNDEKIHKDWIDVHALLHNVCVEIRNERRHNLAFEREFEANYGPRDKRLLKTVRYTTAEGSNWIPLKVHSVQMPDGKEWDALNGWRGADES